MNINAIDIGTGFTFDQPNFDMICSDLEDARSPGGAGIFAPLVKKPLDVAELFEDKVSALIASVGFVPLLASEMLTSGGEGASPPPDAALSVSSDGMLASIAPPLAEISAASFLLVPLMIVLFLFVWLAGHAINVLIVLSPFGIIDGLLKLERRTDGVARCHIPKLSRVPGRRCQQCAVGAEGDHVAVGREDVH